MWSTCLFCSAKLGTNEAIEAFPVGDRVAFDAARGRLWAVCSRCGRWNLAPLEERWEAVESAERLFRETGTRVHSENVGLARLRDGTRLVRIGDALPGELAAWRYGGQLISRRQRTLAMYAAAGVTGIALVAGAPLLVSAGVPIGLLNAGLQVGSLYQRRHHRNRVVHRIPDAESPTGRELAVRRWHLDDAVLTSDDGALLIEIPSWTERREQRQPLLARPASGGGSTLRIGGDAARRVVARSMTDYNRNGASRQDVERALATITGAGGAEAFTAQATAAGVAITRPARRTGPSGRVTVRQVLGTFRGEVIPVTRYRDLFSDGRRRLGSVDALALEIALNEESERQVLAGELAALEAAWREAEEIARIADALPGPRTQQQE